MSIEHEQPEFERERHLPVLKRLYLGRLAVTCGLLEATGVAGDIVTDSWDGTLSATIFSAVLAGGSVYVAHNYHVNGYPQKSVFIRPRAK